MFHDLCFGRKHVATSHCDHVAFIIHLLSRRRRFFVNTVVVTAKFKNILPFVANRCPLSCCFQRLSLRTCLCCCRCNNYALGRRVVFIVSLSSFCCCSQNLKIKYADEEDVCLPLDQLRNVLLFLLLFLFVSKLIFGYMSLFWGSAA